MSFFHTVLCEAPEFRVVVVMQGVAVCSSVRIELQHDAAVAVCCRVLPCVAVCCGMLPCVAACCSVL